MEIDLNFEKTKGLIPAVIQDSLTNKILMICYMNKEEYEKTVKEHEVTLLNDPGKCSWITGDGGGTSFEVAEVIPSFNGEAVLIKVKPRGSDYKGKGKDSDGVLFLNYLQELVCKRKVEMPEGSYTTKLFQSGINKIAQKVGEEAVELIIEAKDTNDELFLNEAADLIYHFLVLLAAKDYRIEDVISILKQRHQ